MSQIRVHRRLSASNVRLPLNILCGSGLSCLRPAAQPDRAAVAVGGAKLFVRNGRRLLLDAALFFTGKLPDHAWGTGGGRSREGGEGAGLQIDLRDHLFTQRTVHRLNELLLEEAELLHPGGAGDRHGKYPLAKSRRTRLGRDGLTHRLVPDPPDHRLLEPFSQGFVGKE